ncbi:hypothetical protein DXV75_00400 [Alteromonas aestuariivivens]|uniref:YecA family protein n=1 Tax=Alteromonas aestuariivivens TaxID=1938339 RepID=A0A3D8MDQ0_9ALTE|nr:UPF0149 family protein [Alteromonas aestuariivivens]RDV28965.1 hypothetical protein DXV75_00400 [Alteromonas aestuariivivens]
MHGKDSNGRHPFSSDQYSQARPKLAQLAKLYEEPYLRQQLPPLFFVKGHVFAVAASPEIPMPETWMPWVIDGQGARYTADHVNTIADALMAELRATLQAMRDQKRLLPAACQWSEMPAQRMELESWLTGLLHGHQRLEACWQEAWSRASLQPGEDPAKRLTRCLKLFTVLANPKLAIDCRPETASKQLRQNLPTLFAQLPAMLVEYVTLAGELAGALPNQFETFQRGRDPRETSGK